MDEVLSTGMIIVRKIPYKPFWFGEHMYFVDLLTGQVPRITPIYLGCSKRASISQLKNYFQENEIEIVDTQTIIKENLIK